MASRSSGYKRKSSGSSKKKGKQTQVSSGIADEVILVLILAISVLLLFSTFGLLGKFGKSIGSVLFGLFGMVAYIVPFFFAFAMFFSVVNKGKRITGIKIGSASLFLLMLCCIAHLIFGRNVNLNAGQKITYFYTVHSQTHKTGGFFGGFIVHYLKKFLGSVGASIVVIALTIISGVLFTERSFIKGVKKGGENIIEDARRMKEYHSKQAEIYEIEKEERNQRAQQRSEERDRARAQRMAQQDAKREANLEMRRERAEKARLEREANAQKARDEARALYLKQQAEEQLKKKQEAEKKALEEQKAYESGLENNAYAPDDNIKSENNFVTPDSQSNAGTYSRNINDTAKNVETSELRADSSSTEPGNAPSADETPAESSAPVAPVSSPTVMTFGPRDDSKRRVDNKVSGVMPHTKLFDLSETNGDIREITSAYDGEVISFDDKVIHTGHRISISDATEEDKAEDGNSFGRTEFSSTGFGEVKLKSDSYQTPYFEKTIKRDEHISFVKKEFFPEESEPAEQPVSKYETEAFNEEHDDSKEIVPVSSFKSVEPEPVVTDYSKAEPDVSPAAKAEVSKPSAAKRNISEPSRKKSASEHKGSYKLPPVSLLNEVRNVNNTNANNELKETGEKLKDILKTFGVNVTISGASRGPSVTRYEIQPEIGTKVSKVVSLTDDIKMALAATDIRMEAPIPGKSAIGIEVPNKENTAVAYRELVESRTFKDAKSKISFAVGKDLNGQVVVTDIDKLPHVLIAGATGSGKSVCINTLIMSILYKATPDDVRLIMVDPKVVELSVYNEIPHLLLPVVTDAKKASAALAWAVNEMMRRYQCFEELQVRNISGYNSILKENPEYTESGKHSNMPQIVIVVDELADLMMVAAKEVEESICRLAQLARAAGIHLVLATQRPSVNVVTGLIKANMPSRIAFSVTSGVDSRTILDMVGAEKLLGKGDMLFYPQNYTKPARVQGAFVSDDEVKRVVEFWKEQNSGSPYDENARASVDNGGNGSSGSTSGGGFSAPEQDNGFDPLFYEAGRSIIEKQKASIGMLQRIHKIGFNRAARIMDQLAEAGVVGPEEGTKARSILMTLEDFDNFIKENNQ